MNDLVCSKDSHPKENNCRSLGFCFFILRLYRQNFPSEIKRDCADEGCQGQTPSLQLISNVFFKPWLETLTPGQAHSTIIFKLFFNISLLWLGKQQPVSSSLFLQSLLGSHKANINHNNDLVHHWNVSLQANNSDSMDYFGPGFWIWNDLSLSEKNWHCPI